MQEDYLIHVLDFEGTVEAGILEYGIVSLSKGKIVDVHTRLCRPGNIEKALKLCQRMHWDITPYEDAPSIKEDWALFRQLRQTGCLAAHHAVIEEAMLKSTWALPAESPDFLNPGRSMLQWGPWVDSCALSKRMAPGSESYQLEHLIRVLGLQAELDSLAGHYCPPKRTGYHFALYDALASSLILMQMFKNNPGMTLFQLIKYSERSERLFQERSQMSLFE